MPMKGVILQQLYPRVGMRQMSDNDILIDPAYRKEVQDYMEKNGYETDSVMQSIHDEYMKKPAYHFEMHIAMLDSIHHPERVAYYRNIKERLQKDAKRKAENKIKYILEFVRKIFAYQEKEMIKTIL